LVFNTPLISELAKSIVGFAPGRSMPGLSDMTLSSWIRNKFQARESKRSVYFFIDEFTNYNDGEIGRKAVMLLDRLGYQVKFVDHEESGRSQLSKALLEEAVQIARKNVQIFSPLVNEKTPLVGVEPSTILSFRDEYIGLLRDDEQSKAQDLSQHVFTIEEFLAREMDNGNIRKEQFRENQQEIRLHGHCHQKALSSVVPTKKLLSFLPGRKVQTIPSGCCGMAGSFGYEKEHFEVSMQIGELVLFPTIRALSDDVLIAAPGTSCRHQIKDGTGQNALHPVEIVFEALADESYG
jgi:Fe-S oxidoreductase